MDDAELKILTLVYLRFGGGLITDLLRQVSEQATPYEVQRFTLVVLRAALDAVGMLPREGPGT